MAEGLPYHFLRHKLYQVDWLAALKINKIIQLPYHHRIERLNITIEINDIKIIEYEFHLNE